MRTITDIAQQFLLRNNLTTTDSFVTDATIKTWITDATTWGNSYHKWPFTEGKSSTTFTTAVTDDNGNTIINYPEGWKADSVRILTIGGKRLAKKDFESFLRFLELNNQTTERIFSDYARQLYVNTGADVSGTLTAYGQYTPYIDVTDENALTVFSDFDGEGNEAIVEKMTGYFKRREHLADEAELHDQRAVAKLDEIWNRVKDEAYKYQTVNQSMFEQFDVLTGDRTSTQFKRNQF